MTHATATSSADAQPGAGAAGGGVVGAAVTPLDESVPLCGAGPGEHERRAPGRPRSAKADEAIVQAVLDLVGEGSTIEALSIEAVAARAGVGKATIYRRWPNKEALVIDAVAAIKGAPPEVSGESIREDLITLLRPMATARSTPAGRILPCLIPEIQRNPDLHRLYQKLIAPRRDAIRAVLARGIDTGQLRPDIDIDATFALLLSPMIVQTTLRLQPDVDVDSLPERLVDTLLRGIAA